MDDHSFRLIDHQQIRVLIHNVEWNILRRNRQGLYFGRGKGQFILGAKLIIFRRRLTVDDSVSVLNRLLERRTRAFGENARQIFVEPFARKIRIYQNLNRLHFRSPIPVLFSLRHGTYRTANK